MTTGVFRSSLRADVMVISAAIGLVSCLAALIVFQQELPGHALRVRVIAWQPQKG